MIATIEESETLPLHSIDILACQRPVHAGDGMGWIATNTFNGLGVPSTPDCVIEDEGPGVASTSPANGATDVVLNALLTVTFSDAATAAMK